MPACLNRVSIGCSGLALLCWAITAFVIALPLNTLIPGLAIVTSGREFILATTRFDIYTLVPGGSEFVIEVSRSSPFIGMCLACGVIFVPIILAVLLVTYISNRRRVPGR